MDNDAEVVGYFTCSSEDLEFLDQWTWGLVDGYPARWDRDLKKTIVAHKEVAKRMGLIGEIDHKDRDKLNTSRGNLRACEGWQNQHNKPKQKNNTSGYKGVTYRKDRDHLECPWLAYITVQKKRTNLGYYRTAKEAAEAYDRAAKDLLGDFAYPNFRN